MNMKPIEKIYPSSYAFAISYGGWMLKKMG